MSKIDGRVSFKDDGQDLFLEYSVLALMAIEEHYDCSIEDLPAIISGEKIRRDDGVLITAPPRYEVDPETDKPKLDSKGDKIQIPPEPPRLKEIVTLFGIGLLEYIEEECDGEEMSDKDVARLISRIGVTTAGGYLEEAVIAAFPEANKGNRQQRRAAASGKPKAAAKKKR